MIKVAMEVNKAVEEVNTIPALGLFIEIALALLADPDPTNISVINNTTFFLIKDSKFFYNTHYQFQAILKYSQGRVFLFFILNF